MSNKETLQSYNGRLSSNNITLEDILVSAESLPNAVKSNTIFAIEDFIQEGSVYDTDGYTMECVSNASTGFNSVYLKEVTDGTYYMTTTTTKGRKDTSGFWYVYKYDDSYFYVINLAETYFYKLNTSGSLSRISDEGTFTRPIDYDEVIKIVVTGNKQTLYINNVQIATLTNTNTIGAANEGSSTEGTNFIMFTDLYKEATDNIKLQVKAIDITKTGQIIITPDEGYDAIARLKLNIAITEGGYDMNYELGEKLIGTWVNGKPLYRYVLKLTSGWTIGGEVQLPHGIEDVEEIWLEKAFWKRSDNNFQTIPSTHSNFTTWGSGIYDFTTTEFRLYMASFQGMTPEYVYVIFNYTKTIDEATE